MTDPRATCYYESKFKKICFNFKTFVRNSWHNFIYPQKEKLNTIKHKHGKKINSIGYLFIFTVMIILCCSMLYKQTQMQAELTTQINNLRTINTQLKTLKAEVKIIETEKYVPIIIESHETVTKYLIEYSDTYSFEYTPNEFFTIDEIYMAAQTLYGEARGATKIQQSGVIWTLCNRYDYATNNPESNFGTSLEEIITKKNQFVGFSWNHPITEKCLRMTVDVLNRWLEEKELRKNNPELSNYTLAGLCGRTLPIDYIFFVADNTGLSNVFFKEWSNRRRSSLHWSWEYANPYENVEW